MADELVGKSFEELVALLESTLARMENDPLTLSEAIDAYEQSVEIARACSQLLDNAELRIRTIDARLMLNGQSFDDEIDNVDVPFD